MPQFAPFGTWTSPLSAAAVASAGLRLSAVALDGQDIYWVEGRPQEGGRCVLVRRTPDGAIADATPPEINVRTRVHEYGGGAYVVANSVVYCTNFSDQRVYRVVVPANTAGSPRLRGPSVGPEPLTPPGACRFADFDIDARRARLICVREDHAGTGEPINSVVAIPLTGPPTEGTVLASGADFYSTPRLSPEGSMLAWLSWRHPLMPWDGTELWVAQVNASGVLTDPTRVAGGPRESIYQPGWSADGTLCYVSDKTGWWQLYRSGGSPRSNPFGSCERERIERSERLERSERQ